MSYKIIDLPSLGRQFNATDIIEVSADGSGSYKANIGNFILGGTNYVFVNANGTPSENGAAVISTYDAAKLMTPNGNPLSATNRITILLSPGYYEFDEGSLGAFTVNASFIDFQSLSGERDVYFSSISVYDEYDYLDVRLSGIDTTENSFYTSGPFGVASQENSIIVIKNCKGGDYSFSCYSSGLGPDSLYEDCEAGDFSFGSTGDGSFPPGVPVSPAYSNSFRNYGTIRNCKAKEFSFCSDYRNDISGSFVANYGVIENCKADERSFCYSVNNIDNYGRISNCILLAGDFGFCAVEAFGGTSNTADNFGIIEYCTSINNYSFCVDNNTSPTIPFIPTNYGTIRYCNSAGQSFCYSLNSQRGTNYGTILSCNANGTEGFMGKNGTNGGFLSDCIGYDSCFLRDGIAFTLYGNMFRCTMLYDSWNTSGGTAGGKIILGIDSTGIVNV